MAPDRSTPRRAGNSDGSGGDLVDRPLQEEIELVGALVAAVSVHHGMLSESEIDQLLGVCEPAGRDDDPEPPANGASSG